MMTNTYRVSLKSKSCFALCSTKTCDCSLETLVLITSVHFVSFEAWLQLMESQAASIRSFSMCLDHWDRACEPLPQQLQFPRIVNAEMHVNNFTEQHLPVYQVCAETSAIKRVASQK